MAQADRITYAAFFVLALFLAGCSRHHRQEIKEPVIALDAFQAKPFSVVGVTILNPDPNASYTVRWNCAPVIPQGFILDVPPTYMPSNDRFFIVAPMGIVGTSGTDIFQSGVARVQVVKHKHGASRSSKWHDLEILPIPGSTIPYGEVAINAPDALQSTLVRAAGDAGALDASALQGGGSLGVATPLISAAKSVTALQNLENMAIAAHSGQSVVCGLWNGSPVVFNSVSARIAGRFFLALNGALADELGSAPPDPTTLTSFYGNLGRDPMGSTLWYPEIVGGAARLSLECVEEASKKQSLFSHEEMGGFVWTSVASLGALNALGMHAMSGQALVMGEIPFGKTEEKYDAVITDVVLPLAEEQFLAGFLGQYGVTLIASGKSFTLGASQVLDLGSVIHGGFDAGLLNSGGVFSFGTSMTATVSQMQNSYSVSVGLTGQGAGVHVRLYTFGSDGATNAIDGVTDGSGTFVFGPITSGNSGVIDIAVSTIVGWNDNDGSAVVF